MFWEEPHNEKNPLPTVKPVSGSVMLWGCVIFTGNIAQIAGETSGSKWDTVSQDTEAENNKERLKIHHVLLQLIFE